MSVAPMAMASILGCMRVLLLSWTPAASSTGMPATITIKPTLTGEKNNDRLAEPQPGGRSPAPGELAVVQSFLNSRWNLRSNQTETFGSGDALAKWLSARGLLSAQRDLGDDDLRRALTIREGLRELAFQNNGHALDQAAIDDMHRASAGARAEIRIDPDGPEFIVDTDAGLDGAFGALYAIVGRAMIDGSWERLKACPGRRC